jgi:single-strand DNA-binding protein
MPSFNKVILAGNLTRDPELRYTPKGTAVAKIGLAMNRQWKDESGQQKEEVTFVDVDAFGRQAEVISQYLKKGRPILIEGRLKLDQWDDKQTNQKRSRLGVVLESFQFLDSGGGGQGGGGFSGGSGGGAPRPAPSHPSSPAGPASAPPPSDDMPPDAEDDVPF